MNSIPDVASWANSATVLAVLALIIWTGSKGVWVFRSVPDDLRAQLIAQREDLTRRIEELRMERDAWQQAAWKSTELAKSGIELTHQQVGPPKR